MTNKNALIIVDLQPGFVRDDFTIVDDIRKHMYEHQYDWIISTVFKNSMYSSYVQYLNWTKLMDEEIPLIPGDMTLVKHGYGLDKYDYQKLFRDFHYDVCGISTEACVSKVAMDLFDLGHDFSVLEWLCRSTGGSLVHNTAIEILTRNIGTAVVRRK